MDTQLSTAIQALFSLHNDPSSLWPQWCAQEKDEFLSTFISFGAILTQRTSWINAQRAIEHLSNEGLLSMKAIAHIAHPSDLIEHIRVAGFYQSKPDRLVAFAKYVVETYGSFSQMQKTETGLLRNQLLGIKGIGEETADTILLYALNKPVTIVDAYTRKWLAANKVPGSREPYGEIQKRIERLLPKEDVTARQQFHILAILSQKGVKGTKMEFVKR